MGDFLKFHKMITPIIIQIIFWIGVILCIIAGAGILISNIAAPYLGGNEFLIGLLILLIGPLAVRIYCELLIVIFRINETLTEIKTNTQRRPY